MILTMFEIQNVCTRLDHRFSIVPSYKFTFPLGVEMMFENLRFFKENQIEIKVFK